ncbi:hypothetical protein ACC691_37390, partial [Rhizobium johnstonii]|uniref:hypothetical protein n=1 Tax=Rhizobium johnstonii TaxID=3019933 RepID=UPI003F973145
LIACAVAAAVLHARRPRLGEALPLSRTGLLLALAWLVIPTTVLLLGNAFVSPMYNIRYVTYSAPAVAVLVTAGAASVPLLLDRMRTALADRRRRGGLISPAPRRLRSGTIT